MEDTVLSRRARWLAIVAGLALAAIGAAGGRMLGVSPGAANLAGLTVLMAVFWATQPIPIAVTSLIPIAAYPLLGINGAKETCAAYGDRNVFLYLGGFIIALGLERWNLHRRIALHTVRLIGSSEQRLVFGFAFATAFISMWISNTATTLLMLPIALSLLQMMEEELPRLSAVREDELRRTLAPFGIALLLAVAFGATCGGISTFVGTPTNTAFRGFWLRSAPAGSTPLSSADWMMSFIPLAILMLFAVCTMTTWRLKPLPGAEQIGREFCLSRLRALGRMGSGERRMLAIFVATALLWITRDDLVFGDRLAIPGWGDALAGYLQSAHELSPEAARQAADDSTVAILMAVLLFLITGRRDRNAEPEPLIDWQTIERRVPWGVLLLFGGGFAMADAFRNTGLAAWLGTRMADAFRDAPLWLIILGTCALVTFLSEFTSNVATVTTILPVLASLAASLDVEPRRLLIPATIAASFGFMLPVATPPNAIVFGTGRVPVTAMMRYGFALDVVGVALITIFGETVIPWVFRLPAASP